MLDSDSNVEVARKRPCLWLSKKYHISSIPLFYKEADARREVIEENQVTSGFIFSVDNFFHILRVSYSDLDMNTGTIFQLLNEFKH